MYVWRKYSQAHANVHKVNINLFCCRLLLIFFSFLVFIHFSLVLLCFTQICRNKFYYVWVQFYLFLMRLEVEGRNEMKRNLRKQSDMFILFIFNSSDSECVCVWVDTSVFVLHIHIPIAHDKEREFTVLFHHPLHVRCIILCWRHLNSTSVFIDCDRQWMKCVLVEGCQRWQVVVF